MTTLNATTTAYNLGYTAGTRRGHEDGLAEPAGRYTRDPSHQGHTGEPPDDMDGNQLAAWVDGFLTGYAHGRDDGMRGAA